MRLKQFKIVSLVETLTPFSLEKKKSQRFVGSGV